MRGGNNGFVFDCSSVSLKFMLFAVDVVPLVSEKTWQPSPGNAAAMAFTYFKGWNFS